MKAVILCGGRGFIDPESGVRIPKGMAMVGDQPLLWHVMKTIALGGVNKFVLALGEQGESIRDYFDRRLHAEDWCVECVNTGTDVQTGSRLAQCRQYLGGSRFLLTYADCLCNIRVDDLVAYHERHGKMLTVTGVQPQWRFGVFRTTGNEVVSYSAKPHLVSDCGYINGGYMVMEPTIFRHVEPAADCCLEADTFTRLARERRVAIYLHAGYWQAIDGERDLDAVNALALQERPWLFETEACHAS